MVYRMSISVFPPACFRGLMTPSHHAVEARESPSGNDGPLGSRGSMPRHRKRIDYAPMSKTSGEIINEVKEAFVAPPAKGGRNRCGRRRRRSSVPFIRLL